MRVFLKNSGIIFILFLGLATAISFVSLNVMKRSSFYKPSFLVNDINENELDYIILGASTGLTTLNTKVIDSMTNKRGVNLAMDDTALSSQLLMLQHFLAQGKSTKYCILAPNTASFDSRMNSLSDNDYRFLPFIGTDYVTHYYGQFNEVPAKLLKWSEWMPLLGVSYFNAEIFYPALMGALNPKKRNRFDDRGNYTYPVRNQKESKTIVFSEKLVNFTNPYVKEIEALCMANNIQLICYFSPVQGKKYVSNSSEYKVIDHSDLFKDTAYFYDILHVNQKGRAVASIRFAESLKTNID